MALLRIDGNYVAFEVKARWLQIGIKTRLMLLF